MNPHSDPIHRRKAQIRQRMIRLREALPTEEVQEKSKAIRRRLQRDPIYKQAQCIHCYVSFRNEVDTHALIEDALGRGIQVVVPFNKLEQKQLHHYRIEGLHELEVGPLGILVPKPAFRRPIPVEDVDLVVVPGLAFDLCGHRIGFGGGFYDRFLASIACPVIALAYEIQVMERVPSGPHDQRVDRIITETRTYEPRVCAQKAKNC